MIPKQRLSATVDSELLEAAEAAVARGEASTVSAWVNEALRLKVERDRALHALSEFIASYEARHGDITPEEIIGANRRARGRALTVRGPAPSRAVRKRRGAG